MNAVGLKDKESGYFYESGNCCSSVNRVLKLLLNLSAKWNHSYIHCQIYLTFKSQYFISVQ